MAVYIIFFSLLFFIAQITKKTKFIIYKNLKTEISKDKFFLFLSWIILSLIEGLRAYSVGTDTNSYAIIYQGDDPSLRLEPLFRLLIYTLKYFSDNTTVFFIVCALITNGLILFAVYRMSDDTYYSVFVYVALLMYFTSFNALRQALAFAFVLNGFYYAREHNWKKYLCLVFTGYLFHVSATVGFFYIPLLLKNKTSKNKYNNFLSNICISLSVILLAIILLQFSSILLQIGYMVIPEYSRFAESRYHSFVMGEGGIRYAIIYSLLFCAFMYLVPNYKEFKFAYALPLAISVVFSFLHLRHSYIIRFMYYFDITSIVSIPYMINNNILYGESKHIFKIVLSGILVAFLIYSLSNNYMRVTPYLFFWE